MDFIKFKVSIAEILVIFQISNKFIYLFYSSLKILKEMVWRKSLLLIDNNWRNFRTYFWFYFKINLEYKSISSNLYRTSRKTNNTGIYDDFSATHCCFTFNKYEIFRTFRISFFCAKTLNELFSFEQDLSFLLKFLQK